MTRALAGCVTARLALAIGTTAVGLCTARHAGAVETDMAISATAIDFGTVAVNTTATTAVTLTNTGGDPFGPINMFGGAPPSAAFDASQNCQGLTLPAGGSCMLTYRFSPTAPGTFNDTSSFTISETPNQADGEDFSVSLTGSTTTPTTSSPTATTTSTTGATTTVSTTSTTGATTTVTTTTTTGSSTTATTTTATGPSTTVTTTTATGPSTTATTTTTTATTVSTTATAPPSTVSTPTTTGPPSTVGPPLPACDPADCDGDACTVGDACVGGTCSAGTRLTAVRLSGLVRQAASAANADCNANRGRAARRIVKSLTRAARLLDQVDTVTREAKRRRKLLQAERAVDRASRKLGNDRGGLAPGCATGLDAVVERARTGLSCLR